jgi:hypothetical protein
MTGKILCQAKVRNSYIWNGAKQGHILNCQLSS